jgi:hypothetical protein
VNDASRRLSIDQSASRSNLERKNPERHEILPAFFANCWRVEGIISLTASDDRRVTRVTRACQGAVGT